MNNKSIISIIGIVLLIIGISGCTDSKENVTPGELKSNSTNVTSHQLYSGSIANGTPVHMKCYVVNSEEGSMTVLQIKSSNGKVLNLDNDNVILVKGNNSNIIANDIVNVWGIFIGKTNHKNFLGDEELLPTISSAVIEKTGK